MSKLKDVSVEVQVDTTQLDEAIKKAEHLVDCLERADDLINRIGKSDKKYLSPPP